MPWPELAALLLFATAMAFTPGPNTTLAAALAANRGLGHAMRFVCAVPVGWGLLLLGVTLGLGALLDAAPVLRGLLQAVGLGYMLWLAWKLARSGALGQADPARFEVGFGQGVLLQFVNVKAWMNALLICAGWVTVADPPWARLALVLPLMMAYGFASNFTYALVGHALRGWLAQGARLLWFNRVLAAVLVATAAWMAGL
ncbi:MAG: LysE family transporter [Ideonella sp. WA131b]|nr:LysE family transporter [Ideonella sp. WA131b]